MSSNAVPPTTHDPVQEQLMEEMCIEVDGNDTAIRGVDKRTAHQMKNINNGLLHRAFSAFVFRPEDGKLLLQQRAEAKITFSNMWTNTCCSHPLWLKDTSFYGGRADEEREEKDQLGVRIAANRKLEHELGIPRSQTPIDAFQYLTRIHYLAPSQGEWGEHEVDYILFMTANVDVYPNPNEVKDHKYVSKQELQDMFEDPSNSFTPWFKLIARDFLYGWWDELIARRNQETGLFEAKTLVGIADGSKVIKMA